MSALESSCSLACTYVGAGPGGAMSILAVVVIVNSDGETILHDYVTPTTPITDWRTNKTGLTEDAWSEQTIPFDVVQERVRDIIRGRTLVGHSLWNDLSALRIQHAAVLTRDVALYLPFRTAIRSGEHAIGLATLLWQFMSRTFGDREDNAVEKSRAAMDLYRSVSQAWEDQIGAGRWPCALPPNTFARCYT